MALDFPASPTIGQTYTAPDGTIWAWDGAKWVAGSQSGAYAPLNSPVFTGDPQAPTAAPGDADTSVATTAFVSAAILAGTTGLAPKASPVFTGNPTGPTPTAGDNDNSLATTAFVTSAVAPVTPALNNVGRNLVHNPLFNIAQRGGGPFSGYVYGSDRWVMRGASDTVTVSPTLLTDAFRAQIGDEAATVCLNISFTGNAAAGAYSYLGQSIESVRRLSGKTVTVSFWANAGTAVKLGVNLLQNFGTGGSPSAASWALATGMTVGPLTTTFTRYSVTIPVPSAAGKTFGTNLDDATSLAIFFSSGASANATAGNIGVQSGGVNIWGVQLEIGSTASPLEKPDPQQDLAKCQRFYQVLPTVGVIGNYALTGNFIFTPITFTTMRATPSVTGVNVTYNNANSLAVQGASNNSTVLQANAVNTAGCSIFCTLLLSADL